MATKFSRALAVIPSAPAQTQPVVVTTPPNPADILSKLVSVRISLWLAEAAIPVKLAEETNKLVDALVAKSGSLDVASILLIQAAFENERLKLESQLKAIQAAGALIEARIAAQAKATPDAAAEVAEQYNESLQVEIQDYTDKASALEQLQEKIIEILTPATASTAKKAVKKS